mgnify:CR=1 FL=1
MAFTRLSFQIHSQAVHNKSLGEECMLCKQNLMELLQCVTEAMRVTAVVALGQEAGPGEPSEGQMGTFCC